MPGYAEVAAVEERGFVSVVRPQANRPPTLKEETADAYRIRMSPGLLFFPLRTLLHAACRMVQRVYSANW